MQIEAVKLPAHAGAQSAERSTALIAAVIAALLGAFLVWGVGFAPIAPLS